MLATLLLASQIAHATDVGTSKRFGIGAALGYPVSVTGKFWLDDKGGIAFFAGTGFTYFNFRGQYERDFIEFKDWDFAKFGMYWDVGAELNVYPGYAYVGGGVGPGIYGGVGAWLRFHKVPAEVFVEVDAGVQYVTYSGIIAPILPIYHTFAGGRWYF